MDECHCNLALPAVLTLCVHHHLWYFCASAWFVRGCIQAHSANTMSVFVCPSKDLGSRPQSHYCADGLLSPPPDRLITIAPQSHAGGDVHKTLLATKIFALSWLCQHLCNGVSFARICVLSRCEGWRVSTFILHRLHHEKRTAASARAREPPATPST